jgi:CDP-diglyceride synthetase
MIALFIMCLVVYGVIGAIAFFQLNRKKSLYWSDIASPVLIIVLWVAITSTGYGHQSLSHIVEVPIVLLVSLVLLYIRTFILDRINKKWRVNSFSILGLSLLCVWLIRTFMPYMPE